MSRKTSLIILIIASIAVHFAFFGHPKEVVFDEVHFGKFVSAYYTHEYSFDIHPPGGKLIIAGFAKLFDFSPEYNFAKIGGEFPDNKYIALRFLPLLAGLLLPIVIYFLALELGLSTLGAFGAGMLIVLENALLTQSRYILLDPFLLLFGFTALWAYLRWRNHKNKWLLLLAGIAAGLSISIKWTGGAFLLIILILELIHLWQDRRGTALRRLHAVFLTLVVAPVLVYFSIFAIHFSFLTKPGEGDAFMTPEFQQKSVVGKFVELNQEMYRANQTLTATHPYGSKWYTWPLMIRPIYYWNDASTTPKESRIYLVGNPFIWWASTVSIIYLVLSIMGDLFSKRRNSLLLNTCPLILLGGYAINFLPFVGISRVMFLYHYLAALIFAILALAYLVDQHKNSRKIWIVLLVVSGLSFLYFAPLSYGLPLEAASFNRRVWLPTWR